MLETVTFLLIKEKLKNAWEIVKKYWQFFLGLTVGLVILVLKRDSTSMRKTVEKFKETSDKMRDRSLEISKEEAEKTSDAIREFQDNVEKAGDDLSERDESISEKRDEIARELLEREKERDGTIAEELQKEIDKI